MSPERKKQLAPKDFPKVMLAADSEGDLNKIPPGAYLISPKHDGIRAIKWTGIDGKARWYSREGNPIPRLSIEDESADRVPVTNRTLDVQVGYLNEAAIGTEVELLVSHKGSLTPGPFSSVCSYWKSESSDKYPFLEPFAVWIGTVGGDPDLALGGGELVFLPIGYRKAYDLMSEWKSIAPEGIMLSRSGSTYKYGRATIKEGSMIKFKYKADREFKVVGWTPLVNKHGVTQPDRLGSIQCRADNGSVFSVGTGFNEAQRLEFSKPHLTLTGKLATVEFMRISKDGIPIQPVFKGVRDE